MKFTDVSPFERELKAPIELLRTLADKHPDEVACIETFIAISLHVMRRTPPGQINRAMQTLEIQSRMPR